MKNVVSLFSPLLLSFVTNISIFSLYHLYSIGICSIVTIILPFPVEIKACKAITEKQKFFLLQFSNCHFEHFFLSHITSYFSLALHSTLLMNRKATREREGKFQSSTNGK
jgi:hypothetical protein